MTTGVRPYRSEDRHAVRRIVFDTGYMGDPVDFLWSDPESFADLIACYYTDREPESLFVVEIEGEVKGFLMGCVDTRRSLGAPREQSMRLMRRGALLRPGVASFLWRSIWDVARDGIPEEALLDPRWPAHLHIDLLPEARGRGFGRRLMNAWFERLRGLQVPGVHLGTFAENANAIPFFEACGYARHGEPTRAAGFRTRDGERMHVQWLVRSLEDA